MTRDEAADKIAKLMRLAQGSSNPHEANSARAQAQKLAQDHGLTDADLTRGKYRAAFDDMVDAVGAMSTNIPAGLFGAGTIVSQVLSSLKTIHEVDKVARVRQITALVNAAHFMLGDNPTIHNLKTTIDNILTRHDLPTR